jgi:hypothetical protein
MKGKKMPENLENLIDDVVKFRNQFAVEREQLRVDIYTAICNYLQKLEVQQVEVSSIGLASVPVVMDSVKKEFISKSQEILLKGENPIDN